MRTPPFALLLTSLFAAACADSGDSGGGSGEKPDTMLRSYGPQDPLIQYVGRVDFEYPNPEYSSPAVAVRIRFEGVSIAVKVADDGGRNYYEAVLDGVALPKIRPAQGQERFVIAEDLEYAEHELSFVKRTEASLGRTLFVGVDVEGQLIEPPTPKARRIEIIGDSISCGAGAENTTSADCADSAWGT